ncbi:MULTISPECIES: TRAP transporter substrate-binding protein DctP [unclassified Sedimentibacter]|uniref:TRAP transporter substrate-binding protein DctP n=1 Tax=unclassified Sedimentibacter TaxID=2649220 RepID=UPI0027E15640|nr:TRAP transporter substrate-binding protein DctP [Sedimentibacter sp. MB35-C1]WMJ76546.1 TRAP transporter substrate-binding protein DctP [Sedimentibacter sp. MB35-C1]
MFKKGLLFLLIITLLIGIIGCGKNDKPAQSLGEQVSPEGNADEKITLAVTSAWAEGNTLLFNMDDFAQKVSEKTNGTVEVVWGGGPETIPSYQLVEALKNGIIDIAWTAHTYNVSHVPVMEAMKLTDAEKLRETGGFDFVKDLYKDKLNAHYIAATTNGLTYNLYTKNEITKLEDFQGLTIRATPAYQAFVDGLGAGVVNTAPGEAYQALERNVIQGYGWPSVGVKDFGWQEVSKYIIQPAFYNVDVCIMMSDKAWNKLSKNQQNAIVEAGKEIEAASNEYYVKAIADENDILTAEGMVELTLPSDVADAYYKLAYEKGWESALRVDPENGMKLKELSE